MFGFRPLMGFLNFKLFYALVINITRDSFRPLMGFLNFKSINVTINGMSALVSVPLWGFLISNIEKYIIYKLKIVIVSVPLWGFLISNPVPAASVTMRPPAAFCGGKIKMARYTRTYILISSANALFSRCGGKSSIKQSSFPLLYHRPSPDRNLFLLIKTYHNHLGLIPHLQSPLSVHLRP